MSEIPLENMSEAARYSFLNIHPELITRVPLQRSGESESPSHIFTRLGQAKKFYQSQPYFYDEAGLFWVWSHDKFCWKMVDEVSILNMIHKTCGQDIITSKERNEITNALKQEGRNRIPKKLPKTVIQFKDTLVDIKTGEETIASPEYFAVNPVPYSLHKDKFVNTPIMDKIFEEWVGKDHVQTLYEIIAYCLLADYPVHRLFCFIGAGMNGKSCFINLVQKFVGLDNCCSTELDTLINSRFEVTRLHKKLVCMMGETNFNELSRTSILKKLTGQDLIGFEYKNKNPFEERNYAKIIISTNNLPETTDKTLGFYRRWMIIDFPHQFSEEKDILSTIPEEEYESLAIKSIWTLHDLLEVRKFHNEGTIEDRTRRYEEKSNPFDKFWKEFIEEDVQGDIPIWEFAKKFNGWAKEHRFREVSEMFINKKMKDKNVQQQRLRKEWFENGFSIQKQFRCWVGIKWL